jgi:hypothetical protein
MRANPLRAWLERERIPVTTFATRIQRSRSNLTRNLLPLDHPDFQIPRRDAMVLIFVLSRGEITPNDFYDLPKLEAPSVQPVNDNAAAVE